MIKVLIVEDSKTVSQYLQFILNSDPEIEVVGNVANGKEAISFIENNKPDIVSMDIDMPLMNGLEATRRIMATNPLPIIIVTVSRNAHKKNISFEALAAGALNVIHKPVGIGHPKEEEKTKAFLSMIKTYSQVKVITRKYKSYEKIPKEKRSVCSTNTNKPFVEQFLNKKYLAIGVSTGGPRVLTKVLSKITNKFPYPILIVQHISLGFIENMTTWLNNTLQIPVSVAKQDEIPLPGHVYFAPDNFQFGIYNNKIKLTKCEIEMNLCPSVEHLFNSLSNTNAHETIAFLLTGMGNDGAESLTKLKSRGAITIAQDEESSLVFGMPKEAIKMGGVNFILNPEQIADLLKETENINN